MRSLPHDLVVRCLLVFLVGALALLGGCVPSASTGACPPPVAGEEEPPEDAPTPATQDRPDAEAPAARVVRSVRIDGEVVDLVVEDGRIARIEPAGTTTGEGPDGEGRAALPAFIDSHVHLLYLPQAAAMADGGVAAAVDLAAPMRFFEQDFGDLRVVGTGPMVTAVGGYPTRSWGSGGYGLECEDADAAVAAVEVLAEAGAVAIKLPVTGSPSLPRAALRAATDRAHALGLRVASHALGSDDALLAAEVGVDVLAHTPVERLSDEAVAAWSERAVISTLKAFGGSTTAVDNLRRLREAGATVLYGTDFGNTRTPGIDGGELALLAEAGLDAAAIVESGTAAPAAFWGLEGLGALAVGMDAALLLVDDPTDPLAPASADVVLGGVLR